MKKDNKKEKDVKPLITLLQEAVDMLENNNDDEKFSNFLEHATETVNMYISNLSKVKSSKCNCNCNTQLTRLPRGTDIPQFWFIDYTRSGCPKISTRYVGDKYGITEIEVSNCGESYKTDRHLKKVRVTGLKEDGHTTYRMFFKDVYAALTPALKHQYYEECKQFDKYLNQKAKIVETMKKQAKEFMLGEFKKFDKIKE